MASYQSSSQGTYSFSSCSTYSSNSSQPVCCGARSRGKPCVGCPLG